MRIGFGLDVHRLTADRRLVLCGVEIPYELGLLGHSDADVGLHALMDALLGAAALGDIGQLFPDTDAQYAGADSYLLLCRVAQLLAQHGYTVNNVDVTLALQRPKIAPYRAAMVARIAQGLGIDPGQVSVKATTTEKLGFEGRGEGVTAYAVCCLQGPAQSTVKEQPA